MEVTPIKKNCIFLSNEKEAKRLIQMQEDIINGMIYKIYEIFVQGLKDNGFIFDNDNELIEFIKTKCEIKQFDNGDIRFSVKNKPFLLYETNKKPRDFTLDATTWQSIIGTFKLL